MAVTLQGLRVLLVEDETLVALLIEELLEELGCLVVAVAMSVDEGVARAAADSVDVAILDVNLSGRTVFPVAATLDGRGIPFVFSTGYGTPGLTAAWDDRPVIQKPYAMRDLEDALHQAIAKGGAAAKQ